MKIAVSSWAPFIGGAEVAVERLAVGLADAGHDVLLVVGTDGEALARFRSSSIRCEFIRQQFTDKLGWLSYRSSRNRLVELLRRERPDIVHSNDLPTHQMTSDATRRLGIPRICHHRWIFDGSAADWFNKFGAERHLFVSNYLRTELCAASQSLSRTERCVVYDGLPLSAVPTGVCRSRAKRALNLPQDRVVVLFVGQIIERKGVADLLNAWAALDESSRNRAYLAIVGDDLEGGGAYRRAMEGLAAQLHVDAKFAGFQINVGQWLTAADVAVVPSHVEPLGNATLEAMANALPVIGSRTGGIPEMIADESTGLLVPPKNPQSLAGALARVIADGELRRRLGEAARADCERRFSLDAHVSAVVEQYRRVLRHSEAATIA